MKHILSSLLLAGALVVSGCSSKSFDASTVSPGVVAIEPNIAPEKVSAAIHYAVVKRGWQITSDTPGQMDLIYKGFPARVTYDKTTVKVAQTGGDREVAGWIRGLTTEIQRNLWQVKVGQQ